MARRIGILTFTHSTQMRISYVWDIKSLYHLEVFARYVSDWTAAEITELTWCREADVVYHRERAEADRREFLWYDETQTKSVALAGAGLDSHPFEYSVVLYLKQQKAGETGRRWLSWPAPVKSLFEYTGLLNAHIGKIMADMTAQCTGISPITFSIGRLRTKPCTLEEK